MYFVKNSWHFAWSIIGSIMLKGCQDKMIMVGITGTKGKSTVVSMLSFVLSQLDINFASYSTMEIWKNKKRLSNSQKMTMPGRWYLPKFFREAYKEGAKIGIVEVTSWGLEQFRADCFDFDVVAITNLQKEHIEIHGGFDNYKKAKGRLFQLLMKRKNKYIDNKKVEKVSIVNFDDLNENFFVSFNADKKYVISIKDSQHNSKANILNLNLVKPEKLEVSEKGIQFVLDGVSFDIKLYGVFNVYNILTALTILKAMKINMNDVADALREYKGASGRMEFVKTKSNINVVVDYAHTPDSLKAVLTALKGLGFKKIISVIGSCGGSGRDKWKRPEMGRIASEMSDYVIITNEDPYDEDPSKIVNNIYDGVLDKNKARIILDRETAIKKAIDLIKNDNEIVILTGKGAEKVIMVKDGVKGFKKQSYEGDYNIAKKYLDTKN